MALSRRVCLFFVIVGIKLRAFTLSYTPKPLFIFIFKFLFILRWGLAKLPGLGLVCGGGLKLLIFCLSLPECLGLIKFTPSLGVSFKKHLK